MRGRINYLFVAGLLAVAMLVAPAGAGAARSSFETGLYVGKTSQGYPVKLRLSLAGAPCGGKPCLFVPNDKAEIYIAEPCAEGAGETNEYLAPFGNRVTASGLVQASQEGFSKTTASFKVTHHGTLTGRIRSTTTLADGTRCDSGQVTLSAGLR